MEKFVNCEWKRGYKLIQGIFFQISEKASLKKGEIFFFSHFFPSFLEWNFSLIREEEKRKFNAYNCHHLCLCTTSITNTSFNEKSFIFFFFFLSIFLAFAISWRKIEMKRKIVILSCEFTYCSYRLKSTKVHNHPGFNWSMKGS